MYGMKFGELHSYRDFKLVPTSKPIIPVPPPRTEFLEVPGRQGEIDISESLAGEVLYGMRTGSFEFLVSDIKRWQEMYGKLLSLIHGKKVQITLDTEPGFLYQGRIYVSEFKSDKNFSLITLEYKLEPYKYIVSDLLESGEIIHKIENIVITENKTYTLSFDSDMTLVPEFFNKTEQAISLECLGKSYKIPKGKSRFPEVRGRKDLELHFSGNGTIDISYRRGWL